MTQNAGGRSPLDEAGTPGSHKSKNPEKDDGPLTVTMKGHTELPLVTATRGPAEGGKPLMQHHTEEAREAIRQGKLSEDCCCGSSGSGGNLRDKIPSLEGETRPQSRDLALKEAANRADCGGKDSRSSSSYEGVPSLPRQAQERPLFCSVGVHSLTPSKLVPRKRNSSALRPQQQPQEQQPQHLSDAGVGDAQQAPQAEAAAAPGASVPLGTAGTHRKQLSCEDCAWVLPAGGARLGGSYHLLRQQQQQPKQGEFVAGSLQWGHPTSFWLVESDSRIALSSFRLLVTFMVVLAALKYGVSTYFPPAMQTAFICFFCADILIWGFFSCEAALRARAMGLKRFFRDRQCLFDTFLQLVGLSAIFLRVCILVNAGGLGTRVFDPDSLERRTGIANDFIIGDVQIALVASFTAYVLCCGRLCLFWLSSTPAQSSVPGPITWVTISNGTNPPRRCSLYLAETTERCADEEEVMGGREGCKGGDSCTKGWNNVATATAEKHPFSRIFFVAYICFTTLTLLNIVTGIILDAYVDMSNRLLKEANYKDDLEKDIHNEKVLLSAFEKTSFLVCMRPSVSTFSSEGSAFTTANLEHATSGWAGGDSGQESTIPTLLREGETTTTWRHAAASSSMVTQAAASASQSPRAPMCAAGAHFERKLTGVASEDSTARPSTESATDSEPLQIRTHLPDTLHLDGINVRTCVRYLRIGGHQPMDILRDPIVQDALQAAQIPFYQAFDVLSMFHQRGIQFVTVKEFAEACSRVVGSATGRQLLQVQLELQQKLCALEQCIRSLSRPKQFRNNYSTTSKLDFS
ncbi:hypothetical protein, conserved [Eimeria praecox]|uniref:Ion transport domain-containing protein n=1 Tax=Eimeria praecox TaxID=51316 RepID=U6H412_9EIME|nr:hypothetical protein, conserved [Eimeria praecox]